MKNSVILSRRRRISQLVCVARIRERSFATLRMTLTVTLYFLLPTLVFAAGGGGGGGGGSSPPPPPECTAADWSCEQWSPCSTEGTQTRTCSVTTTCTATLATKPPETQSCSPPPPAPTPPAAELQSGEPPSPEDCSTIGCGPPPICGQPCGSSCGCCDCGEGQVQGTLLCKGGCYVELAAPTPPPPCTQDTWTCAGWDLCNKVGHQTRTCTRTTDCPSVTTPKPATDRVCPGLKCGHLPTLRQRITCRLQLTPEDFTKELSIQYAPELCRAQKDKKEWQECLKIYRDLAPCWSQPDGAPRIACAKRVIGLPEDLRTAKQACIARNGAARTTCLEEFKEKVLWLSVFRMYNLEVKAELLIERGAPWARVAEFDAQVEEHKIAFYEENKTNTERKKIVQSLQTAWRLFIEDVKPKLPL